MASYSDFVYTPLNHTDDCFRLLRIGPPGDASSSPLRGILRTFRRQDAPPYQPVSYTWGTQDPSSELLLKEFEDTKWHRFPIRPNLETLLRQFRSSLGETFIWVDAICINQSDNEEKGFQVRNMDKIYRGRLVNIWLGEPSHNSDLALDMIDQLMADHGGGHAVDPSPEWVQALTDFIRSPSTPLATWQAVYDIICRPWFSRRWIVQEFVLSEHQHFWLGSRSYCFFPLYILAKNLGRHPWYPDIKKNNYYVCPANSSHSHSLPSPVLDPLEALERLWTASEALMGPKQSGLTLERLLDNFVGFYSYDPRDAIYAFISMASDIDVLEWTPDYSDKNSVTSLYAKATLHIIGRTGFTDIICRSAQQEAWGPFVSHFSSWIPWYGPQKVVLSQHVYGESSETQTDRKAMYELHGYNTKSLTTFGQPLNRLAPGQPGSVILPLCDGCGQCVQGTGVKCQDCPDFDYCCTCARKSDLTHDHTHRFSIHNRTVYSASGLVRCYFNGDVSPSALSDPVFPFGGFMVDSIRAVGHIGHFSVDSSVSGTGQMSLNINQWMTLPGMEERLDENGVPDESFYRTITGNRMISEGRISYATDSWISALRKFANGPKAKFQSSDHNDGTEDIAPKKSLGWKDSVEVMLSNQRKFATTTGKSIGMVPVECEPGDDIAIIMGCSVPVIIRRCEKQGDRMKWRLIGECYIDGLMDGEFIARLTEDDLPQRIFIR